MFENWTHRRMPWPEHMFVEMDRLHRELGRLFNRRPASAEFPPINVWANADGAIVTAEVPGLDPGDVALSVSGGMLTLRGERGTDAKSLGAQSRAERRQGVFSRTIEMPFQVDSAKVEARCENGLLTIRLPRADSDKPRVIAVRGA